MYLRAQKVNNLYIFSEKKQIQGTPVDWEMSQN